MSALRRLLCAALAVAAVGIASAGWAEPPPEVSGQQAVRVTTAAFDQAGITARVGRRAIAETYVSVEQGTVDVWRVRARTAEGEVDLLLARVAARPVAIDDRTADGTGYLLSGGQYDAVALAIEDPVGDRAMREQVALTIGAVLIVGLSVALALVPGRRS